MDAAPLIREEENGRLRLPGFCDVHVHFREPGFEAKGTIATESAAALAGGYTDVFTMPNLAPVPDAPETLAPQLEAIRRTAAVRVHPFASISKGEKGLEISDLEALAPLVRGFSDDGRGVQDAGLLREAMRRAKDLERPIVAHCEDNSLLVPGGCIHAGHWAEEHGFTGISSASEWKMVERDLGLVRETGCRYHVCHVSTKESVAILRAAKEDGLPVTCETAPHYLVLTEDDLRDEGRFKMNPPLRASEDRAALRAGILDGTIDCIATDHAPHTDEEKSRGLRGSPFGVVGLECAFPVLYTDLVRTGIIPLETILDRLCVRPRAIFGLPEPDLDRDYAIVDTTFSGFIDPSAFRSKAHATPFDGRPVACRIIETKVG